MILVTDLNNTMPKFQSSIIMMPGSDRQTELLHWTSSGKTLQVGAPNHIAYKT